MRALIDNILCRQEKTYTWGGGGGGHGERERKVNLLSKEKLFPTPINASLQLSKPTKQLLVYNPLAALAYYLCVFGELVLEQMAPRASPSGLRHGSVYSGNVGAANRIHLLEECNAFFWQTSRGE